MHQQAPKLCLACNKPLLGRTDKKFCNDYCRNAFNNQRKPANNSYIRSINNQLLKNRRILESLLPATEEMSKASKDKLTQLGFVFKYSTHSYVNKKGNVYFFCYDYGYLPLDNDVYLIVKRRETN
ncbi:hypothetical protein QTN47_15925 [Danxiaibacter flavus]|uniref:DUF2116 family Zn-ribbon domain-containing protein n=1 Tax=Danxiaibacter flavus TaxID=3049108 RepID=A0ABV3ZGI0_9BACT|nr:hypothetical protein QNM32_15935 [Chitinophagaceae bacterium DXS]